MRLCLASIHPRVLSGQIDSLAGLGRALDRRGHAVRLVTPSEGDLLNDVLTDIDAGPRKLMEASRAMMRAVPRIINAANDSDVLHLALPTPAFGWLADLVQLASKSPVLISFESHLASVGQVFNSVLRPHGLKSRLPLWAVNNGLFGRLTAHLCQCYVVSSEYQRQELVALGIPAERVSVLTNVVEASKLQECDPRWARRRLGLRPNRPTIGYIGHFNDVKGVDVLASAFSTLVEQGRDVELALAWSGQGDARPIQRRLSRVSSHVTWLGKVHVGTFLCGIDVLALPYRSTAGQGAYPSLVLEALHLGRPLVTSSLPLLEEIAMNEQVALLCPPERPDLLAAQLDRLLASEELRRDMSRRQILLAQQRFAADSVARHYEALYSALIAGREDAAARAAA